MSRAPPLKGASPAPVEERRRADVGDRFAVASKGEPRSGVVTAVSGAMITVRWDRGGETSLIPAPGIVSVVTSRRGTRSARISPETSGATPSAKKTSVAGLASGGAGKAAAVRKPVVKKVAPNKVTAGKKVAAEQPGDQEGRGRQEDAVGQLSRRRHGSSEDVLPGDIARATWTGGALLAARLPPGDLSAMPKCAPRDVAGVLRWSTWGLGTGRSPLAQIGETR